MVAFWAGDTPAEPLPVVPARDGDPIDLTDYTGASAVYTTPAGTTVPCTAVLGAEDVEVQLPTLTDPGIGALLVKLTGAGGKLDSFDAGEGIVVQPTDWGWHTLVSARRQWQGAVQLDDDVLWTLLEQAKLEVAAFAPAIEGDGSGQVPTNYRRAQVDHARNRNAASRVDPATGQGGVDGYTLGAFPLDWTIKQQLRPQRRMPVVL